MERRSLVRLGLVVFILLVFGIFLHRSSRSALESLALPNQHHPSISESLTPPPATTFSLEPLIDTSGAEEHEDTIDGVRRHTRRVLHSRPKYLFLVLTRDADSWGYNLGHPRRKASDFLDLLTSTGLDFKDISLGFLTGSEDEYVNFQTLTRDLGFAATSIFLHPGYSGEDLDRDNRHEATGAFQTTRRGEIAKLRNYLMLRTLRDEPHVFWQDSDIYELHSPDILQTMISHAGRDGVGIITARCEIGDNPDYDHNAWAGWRQKPLPEDAEPGAAGEFKHLKELLPGTSDDELVPLDSVGATLLYIRASLVHQGLTFSDSYAVGTTWVEPGWDGIESEALCYRAKGLSNGGCWVLGGKWYIRHTDR